MARPETVVDYDAWKRGYMPPSEHLLIDKLAYRGAKVILSTAVSKENQMWIVIEGPPLSSKARKFLQQTIAIWFEAHEEDRASYEYETPWC